IHSLLSVLHDTAATLLHTLSLHYALPISSRPGSCSAVEPPEATYSFKHALVRDAAYESLLKSRRQQLHGQIARALEQSFADVVADRKSTRLNSSHVAISYAVFCLK